MSSLNPYDMQKDYELNRLPVIEANAEQHRMLTEAGVIRRLPLRVLRVWLSCRICGLLWRLGRLLATAGQRLERRPLPLQRLRP